ncbi:MAG: extracellular solute-binding protein [Acidobacteria bacterium]|nr:extracellular solute-binding protein [Acidobacteriota bacterium]
MTPRWRVFLIAAAAHAGSAALSVAQPLVTPVRVGRADAPMKLTVWAQQDYSHLAALAPVADTFQAVFTKWAVANPGVQLEVSMMPALEQHKAKLLLAAAAGRLPDVASIDSFWLPLFLEGGHLQPLNPYWPDAHRADFLPFTIDTLSDRSGNVYGVWHETDCRALFYRKDLVPVPPQTWDELLAVASRTARDRGIAGYLYNAGRWEATVFDHLPMFWAQGGELVDPDGRPVFGLAPHRDRLVRVLTFLRDTVQSGASPRAVLASNDYKQLSAAAIAGDTAMFLGGNWQIKELEDALSPEEFAKWSVAPIPQLADGPAPTGSGGWIWVVFSKDPEKRRAAAQFILDVEAPDNAARISQATGHLPAQRSVYRDHAAFQEEPFRFFGNLLDVARARPAVPIYNVISRELQVAIGYAIEGTRSPESAIDEAFRVVVDEDRRRRASVPRPAGRDPLAWAPGVLAALVGGLALLGAGGRGIRIWLIPTLALATVFLLYPILELVRIAFTDLGAPGGPYRYTLHGFRSLAADPQFYGMVGVTLIFVLACVSLQLVLGLLLAWLFDAAERRRVIGSLAARVAVVSAWVIPGVLIGVIWKILLIENRSGIVNYWLSQVGLGPAPLLSSGSLALVSVIIANTWRGTAFSMLMQYAGLRRIPRELHEAADLEGLNGWQRLRWVILPAVAPVILLNVLLITIYTLNTFDMILPLTAGGPARRTEVVSLYMYRSAFYDLDSGKSAAIAMVMLAINVALAWGAVRLMIRHSSPTAGAATAADTAPATAAPRLESL